MASTYIEIPSPTAGTAGVTSFNSRSGVVVATAGDYTAAQVDYDNSGSGLAATDVQAAIDELEAEKQPLVSLTNSNFVVSDSSGDFSTLTDWSYNASQGEEIASIVDIDNTVQIHHTRQLGLNAAGAAQSGESVMQRLYLDLDPDNNGGSIGSGATLSSMLRLEHATTGSATMENLVSMDITGLVENVDNYSAIRVGVEYNSTDPVSDFKAIEVHPTGEAWVPIGISINMSDITASSGETIRNGLVINNGGIASVGSYTTPDDDKLGTINYFESTLTVESGTPLTQKDFLATLMLPTLDYQDDYNAGPVGIGYVSTGFILNFNGAVGKTVDKASAFVAAISPQNADGTISELNAIRIALIPAAAMTITNFRAIAIEDTQGSSGVNNWGLYFDDVALENYLKKSLVIGDADTVTNASVGFELNATDRAVLLSRMDSTQRDALTEVAGMIIFNTTTNKFQGYDGTVWADLN